MQIFDAALAGNLSGQNQGDPSGKDAERRSGGLRGCLARLAVVLALMGFIAAAVGRTGTGETADAAPIQACGYSDVRTCID